jgi:hypothetical protein
MYIRTLTICSKENLIRRILKQIAGEFKVRKKLLLSFENEVHKHNNLVHNLKVSQNICKNS